VKLFRLKIWVRVRNKKQRLEEIGYLKHSSGSDEAAEVYLAGGGKNHPIGRVILDEEGEKGFVEVLLSDYNEESENLKFRQCGYIDADGYIYKQISKHQKPERVGYTARPSRPNEPTIYGERTWKTLWMVKTLYAYAGNPAMEKLPEKEAVKPSPGDVGHWVLNSPVGIEDDPLATEPSQAPVPEPATPTEESPTSPSEPMPEPTPESVPESAPESTPESAPESAKEEAPEEASKEEKTDVEKQPEADAPKSDDDAAKDSKSDKKSKDSKKKSRKKKKKMPVAVCYQRGFRSTRRNPIPAEARACAFALFFNSYNKKKYSEFYRNHPYGWRDTALLTTLVYSLLFLVAYSVSVCLMGRSLLGENIQSVLILIAFYYILWIFIRKIKILAIENSSSFQPKLDLLNKSLGQSAADILIVILSVIAIAFTLFYYDYDFLPLIWSIGFGAAINFSMKKNRQNWKVLSTFQEEDEESEEGVKLPDGDISRTYEWELDSLNFNKENRPHGSLTLYFSADEMSDIRKTNPFFAQRSERSYKEYILEMFQFMKSHPSFMARSMYIKDYILNAAKTHYIQNELDIIQFTLDFVQEPNIKFSLNRDSKSIDQFQDYIRFPDETLYDKEGDCNSKSLLAAILLHLMGHNVLYVFSRRQQHAAIGIELTAEMMDRCVNADALEIVDYNGKRYIFCETTGDTFKVGQTMSGMSLDDFEDKVELPFKDSEDEEGPVSTMVTRLYHWDLDSVVDPQHKLHGSLAIEFNTDEVKELREINPFRSYGADGNTYEQNIKNMFSYFFEEDERYKKVKLVADYIRESIQKESLPELDLIQFTLDFAQEPNIHYCFDENSSSIGFPKEYMRFPDEVMYDKEGDCDCKSSLTCALLHQLGYNVIFLLSAAEGHAAVGVELNESWLETIKSENPETIIREYNGKKYIFCETTGDGNKIGHIKEDKSIQDFETIVELPA